MADPTIDQVKQMRTAVLGAAAKVPGALIGLGILFIVLGMVGVAGQTLFSFVSINMLGAFLIVGGILQGVHALKSHGWKSVGIQAILAILYIAAGLYTWAFPIPALEVITLWLAAIFFVTGFLQKFSYKCYRTISNLFRLVSLRDHVSRKHNSHETICCTFHTAGELGCQESNCILA